MYVDHPEVYDEETAALLRSGDSPLNYPGQHFTDCGRGVEGDPSREAAVHGRRGVRDAHRRSGHASPQGLPPRPALHAAVHRLPGRGDAGAPHPGRRADRADRRAGDRRPLPGAGRSRASRRMPTSTSWRHGSATSGEPAPDRTAGRSASSSSTAIPTRPRPSRAASAPSSAWSRTSPDTARRCGSTDAGGRIRRRSG